MITNAGNIPQTFVPSLHVTSFFESNYDINNIGNTFTKFQGHPIIVVLKEQVKESSQAFAIQNVSTDKVASIVQNYTQKMFQKLMSYLQR